MDNFQNLFFDDDDDDDDDCDLFVDASPNVSGQSSYWSNLHSCVLGSFIFLLLLENSFPLNTFS